MERIKFYGASDFSADFHLKRVRRLSKSAFFRKRKLGINDEIELYNCGLFISKGVYLKKWRLSTLGQLRKFSPQIESENGRFFASITDANILGLFEKTDRKYARDFLCLFAKYHLERRISKKAFSLLLAAPNASLPDFLSCEAVVSSYGNVIMEKMLSGRDTVPVLHRLFLCKGADRSEYSLPAGLGKERLNELIASFLTGDGQMEENLAVIESLSVAKAIAGVQISEDNRLAAAERAERARKALYEDPSKFTSFQFDSRFGMVFSETQEKPLDYSGEPGDMILSVSTAYLSSNTDSLALLNNLCYVFPVVDGQIRAWGLPEANPNVLADLGCNPRQANCYNGTDAFREINVFADLVFKAYYDNLEKMGFFLEDLLSWGFNEYLASEYEVGPFGLSLPKHDSSPLEKCKMLMPEVTDRVIKCWQSYVGKGKIDEKMVESSSFSTSFSGCPSAFPIKNVYNSDDGKLSRAESLLFSDQSGLGYTKNQKYQKDTFYALLSASDVPEAEFADYQIEEMKPLLDLHLLYHKDGRISLGDATAIALCKSLYDSGFVVYWSMPKGVREKIDALLSEGLLRSDGKLLSSQEADYFEYLLHSKYDDGKAIRNKYDHGGHGWDDEERMKDYLIGLRLLSVLFLKISISELWAKRYVKDSI